MEELMQDILNKLMKSNFSDISTRWSNMYANYYSTIRISKIYNEHTWIIEEEGSGKTITESIETVYIRLLSKIDQLIELIDQFDVYCKYRMIDGIIYSSISVEYFEKSDFSLTRKTSIQFNVTDSKESIELIVISSKTIIKEILLKIKESIS